MQLDTDEAQDDVEGEEDEDGDERLTAASLFSLGSTTRTRFPGEVLTFSEELRMMNEIAESLREEGSGGTWEESDEQRLSFLRLAVREPSDSSFFGVQPLWEEEREGEGGGEGEDEYMRSDVELEFEDEDELAAELAAIAASEASLPFPPRRSGPALAENFMSTLLASAQRATAQSQTSSILPNPNPNPLPASPLPPINQPPSDILTFHAGSPSLRRAGIGANHPTPIPSTVQLATTTAVIPASGSNRLSVIGRTSSSRNRLDSTNSNPRRTGNYSAPFPIPDYLRHSTFAGRFATSPAAEVEGEGEKGKARTGPGIVKRGAQEEISLPTCWSEEDKCALIELKSDGLGVHFAGSFFFFF